MSIRRSAWAVRTLIVMFGLVAASTVQSAAFRVAYDPQFSTDPVSVFGNLGFQGQGVLDVPNTCLANEGIFTCAGAEFTALDVELYNYKDNIGNPTPTILETVQFVPPPLVPNPVTFIAVDVVTSGGMLVGVATPIFGSRQASSITTGSDPDPLPLPGPYNLWLDFNIENPMFDFDTGQLVSLDARAYLIIGNNCADTPTPASCARSQPSTVHFFLVGADSQVPEPATIALLLTGLSLLAFVSAIKRRRFGGLV